MRLSARMRCLITAGPTREHLDPVRYISNGSSGKMGYALAAEAAARGWTVELVSGPVGLQTPAGVDGIRVVSAEEMYAACTERFDACDLFIAVAAVADYRPAVRADQKQPKSQGPLTLELVPNIDILRTLAARKRVGQTVVGFAAETERVLESAERKLREKNCDWIVANDVGVPGIGMDADANRIVLLSRDGRRLPFGPAPKPDVARFILDAVMGSRASL